jgi:putative DNA primase/helicase
LLADDLRAWIERLPAIEVKHTGRKAGGAGMACCPAHEDREPSLSIRSLAAYCVCLKLRLLPSTGITRLQRYCEPLRHLRAPGPSLTGNAGCDQRKVIAVLRSRGVWETEGLSLHKPGCRASKEPDPDALKRTEAALAIWQGLQPAEGTLAETYLRSRGLHVSSPPAIRFHAGLKHPSGGTWPAMVAHVTLGVHSAPIAIHRTFLTRDAMGKAPVDARPLPWRSGAARRSDGAARSVASLAAASICSLEKLMTAGFFGD